MDEDESDTRELTCSSFSRRILAALDGGSADTELAIDEAMLTVAVVESP